MRSRSRRSASATASRSRRATLSASLILGLASQPGLLQASPVCGVEHVSHVHVVMVSPRSSLREDSTKRAGVKVHVDRIVYASAHTIGIGSRVVQLGATVGVSLAMPVRLPSAVDPLAPFSRARIYTKLHLPSVIKWTKAYKDIPYRAP